MVQLQCPTVVSLMDLTYSIIVGVGSILFLTVEGFYFTIKYQISNSLKLRVFYLSSTAYFLRIEG